VLRVGLTVLCLLCGCGDDLLPTFDYPLDDQLALQHLQAKATHNSYHLASESTFEEWDYSHAPLAEQLRDEGVREIELDVYYIAGQLVVEHVPHADPLSVCPTLDRCLEQVRDWSDAHPAHHALVVQIEVKDSTQPEIDLSLAALEEQILAVWPLERIITPDEVRGAAPSLAAALAESGWPTLGETRGRVLFALDNRGEVRDRYLAGSPALEGRLAFIDSAPGDPFAGFAVLNDPIADAAAIAEALAANMLVRTRADADLVEPRAADTTRRDAALASGAQFVSTDVPVLTPDFDYRVDIPSGQPSRCNPVTAPAICTARAIEEPAFLW
jgi:hypothetical protein